MTNPFLSTPEATAFWREQRQACEEARRLCAKYAVFAPFLAAGGTIDIRPMSVPVGANFVALLKDGDSVICAVPVEVMGNGYFLRCDPQFGGGVHVSQLTAWLTEARDGVRELPTVADIARARTAVEVHDAPKRLEANNERPKYDIHKAC